MVETNYSDNERPRIVLICHVDDSIDTQGLSSWLASTMDLAGLILIRERPLRFFSKVRREIRRVGWIRFLDVIAFRVYYKIRWAKRDAEWVEHEVTKLRARYPVDSKNVDCLIVQNPNGKEAKDFLLRVRPDMIIARCKFILKPEIFNIPANGTYVLHPGICPEYRNAHGCFWALVNRDLDRIGMTLLRVDAGVDTGDVFMHASYQLDERNESPLVIQYRVVLENLDTIADCLVKAWREEAIPLPVAQRKSATWGQPWLTAYIKWKRAVNAEGKKCV